MFYKIPILKLSSCIIITTPVWMNIRAALANNEDRIIGSLMLSFTTELRSISKNITNYREQINDKCQGDKLT